MEQKKDKKPHDIIDYQSLKRALEKFGYKHNRQLANELGIIDSEISKFLSNTKNFTNWHKIAFYYFFKCKELQRQLAKTPKHTKKSDLINELITQLEKLKDQP